MKTIEVNKDNALKAFNEADEQTKKMLKNLFGAEHFNQKITDRIKTFDDVLRELKITSPQMLAIGTSENGLAADLKSISAYTQLILIARVLNEGWKPNWADSNESKYYPWLKYTPGSGFSYSFYDHSFTGTCVGSRLCFKTRELAEYAATQFKDVYNDFLTL